MLRLSAALALVIPVGAFEVPTIDCNTLAATSVEYRECDGAKLKFAVEDVTLAATAEVAVSGVALFDSRTGEWPYEPEVNTTKAHKKSKHCAGRKFHSKEEVADWG